MKAQRGKIILLCLCLIFAMLIISGKASKLGTYLYVRCNYTHLEEFAAEVIQTGAIPDDRYKRRDVRYYPECGMIEFPHSAADSVQKPSMKAFITPMRMFRSGSRGQT